MSSTDKHSIESILESEAGIANSMAKFFSAASGAVDIIQDAQTYEDKLALLNTILNSYADNEKSISLILDAVTKKIAANNNISPASIINSSLK